MMNNQGTDNKFTLLGGEREQSDLTRLRRELEIVKCKF